MRRRLLAMTMGLGLVVTAMGFSGIHAVFSDRATTGTNSAESGAQARIADLKIATTTTLDCTDGSFTDDLASGLIDVADLQPGGGSGFAVACLRNDGTAALNLTVTAIDVTETETGCTGDEAAAGDPTCGTAGDGDGELGPVLLIVVSRLNCDTEATESSFSQGLTALSTTPESLGSLAPGATTCIWARVQMATEGQLATTLADIQQAQSDKVAWRFAFDGVQS